MLITVNEILDCGLPISEEIDTAKITRAITTVENMFVKPRLGSYYLQIINNTSDYDAVINGGVVTTDDDTSVYLAGLKQVEYELAFAHLLMDNIAATSFGSVIKKDEFSDQANLDKIKAVAEYHWNIGYTYLSEITDYLGIDNNGYDLPDFFNEYL